MSVKVESYKAELTVVEDRIAHLKQERDRLIKLSGPKGLTSPVYDGIGGRGGYHPGAIETLNRIVVIENELEELRTRRARLTTMIDRVRRACEKMPLAEKILYLRDHCGMNLAEIAEEIGMSYDYVRHVAAKMDKNR